MCSFFGPRTDSMKHNLSPWGTGSIGKLNVRGGLHSELGDGFRVRICGVQICLKEWGFEVRLWGFGILEFGV